MYQSFRSCSAALTQSFRCRMLRSGTISSTRQMFTFCRRPCYCADTHRPCGGDLRLTEAPSMAPGLIRDVREHPQSSAPNAMSPFDLAPSRTGRSGRSVEFGFTAKPLSRNGCNERFTRPKDGPRPRPFHANRPLTQQHIGGCPMATESAPSDTDRSTQFPLPTGS